MDQQSFEKQLSEQLRRWADQREQLEIYAARAEAVARIIRAEVERLEERQASLCRALLRPSRIADDELHALAADDDGATCQGVRAIGRLAGGPPDLRAPRRNGARRSTGRIPADLEELMDLEDRLADGREDD